jgi:formylglycine-generating enzyme required for sulfatase activity
MKQVSYEDAVEEAASLGVRLNTPEEWEYACGAGARTLFRWGEDNPDDGYPAGHRTRPLPFPS